MSKDHRFLSLLAGALLSACGGEPSTVDGGTARDSSRPMDTGVVEPACIAARAITLTLGAQTISGDTSGMSIAPARSPNCGGSGTEGGIATELIAVTFPGASTELVGMRFSLVNDGTDEAFDTVVEVRETCSSGADNLCFDDTSVADYRSSGGFAAPGGSTRYLLIRGYLPVDTEHVDHGAWQMDVTTYADVAPPTLTDARVMLFDESDLLLTITGGDVQGAASGLRVAFVDDVGMGIPIDVDMRPATPNILELSAGFRPSVLDMTSFVGSSSISRVGSHSLGDFPEIAARATSVRIGITSQFDLESATMFFPLERGVTVPVGAACDDAHRCTSGIDCTTSVCTIPAPVVTACAGATALAIATPTTIVLGTEASVFEPSSDCYAAEAGGDGPDVPFTLEVPPGRADLVLDTTDVVGPDGMADTVLHVRSTCGDPATELACNDDRESEAMPPETSSHLEILDVAPGNYTVVLDAFQPLTEPHTVELTASLRPVLSAGDACDPSGVMNRCAADPCPSDGAAVCP